MRTFDEVWAVASLVNGPLTKEEARELWRLAEQASGDVVEIGCGLGQASILLAGYGPIVCTDHVNSTCHQDQSWVWRTNILHSGYASNIELLTESDGFHVWESPVGLLHINLADPRLATRQIRGWDVHLLRGAALCVYGDVTPPSSYRVEKSIGRLTTYRKV